MASGVDNWNPTTIGYFVNNVPWILKLENGGYPKSPKKGTYVGKGQYEIRSSGGFSIQAPAGMVKVSVAEYESILKSMS